MSLSACRRLVNSRGDCKAEANFVETQHFDLLNIFDEHRKQLTEPRPKSRGRIRRRRRASAFASMSGEYLPFPKSWDWHITRNMTSISLCSKSMSPEYRRLCADKALATPSSVTASKPRYVVDTGAPAWRVVLGNIAAGATAGAVVEAGAPRTWHLKCGAIVPDTYRSK
jgi:hypothetical protein